MSTTTDTQPTIGVRIVAVLMIVGGVSGVIGSSRIANYFVQQYEYSQIVVPCCSILLFAWTAWVGWGIWRGKAHFIGWAKILFAMQVIVFSVGGFAYELFIGLSVRISVGGWLIPMPPPSHQLLVGANLGSSLNLHLTRENSQWMVGINLVGLIVLIYLFRISRVSRADVETVNELAVKPAIENGPGADAAESEIR